MPPTIVILTIVLSILGVLVGGGLGARWALRQPRNPPPR
jgi:hypothetical protein